MCGAADEVLLILKNDRIKDRERKRECESLLGTLSDERFAQLVNLGKKLTDWSNEQVQGVLSMQNQHGGGEDEEMDETIGVNVMIGDEEDEDEDENDMHEINDNDEEEEEEEAGLENGTRSSGLMQSVIKGKVC